jgi:hypothetical protein
MTPAEADRARIADRVEAAAFRDMFEGAPLTTPALRATPPALRARGEWRRR